MGLSIMDREDVMTPNRTTQLNALVTTLIALALSLAFATTSPATEGDLRDYQRAERKMLSDYRAGLYDKALETANKLHEMRPNDPVAMYNVACLHCLLGDKDKAYEWLEKAADSGYRDAEHMQKDYDLRTLWGEDRFRSIVRRVRDSKSGAADASRVTPGKPSEKKKEADGSKDDAKKNSSSEEDRKPPAPQSDRELITRIQELTESVIQRAEKKEYKEALKLAKESVALAETLGDKQRQSLTNYNVACMHAMLGQKNESIRRLAKSVELGGFRPDMARQIEEDSDFDSIRSDPRYLELLEKVSRRKEDRVDAKMHVILPKSLDKTRKAPLLVVLHPWGGNMSETAEKWQKAADEIGAILLAPQGTIRLADGEYRWDAQIDKVEDDVLKAVSSVTRKHSVNEKQIVLAGFSQGAWAGFGLAVRNPDMFRGVVAIGGDFDDDLESAASGEDLSGMRVVIMVGKEDEPEILEANRKAEECFKRLGAKVRYAAYDNMAHEYPKSPNTELTRALEFILTE